MRPPPDERGTGRSCDLAVESDAIVTHLARPVLAGTVCVREGQILSVISGDSPKPKTAAVCGGPGSIVVPGLVNAHHHTGLTPLQHGIAYQKLETWLPQLVGVRSLDAYLDTLYAAMEMLRCGVTTVQHIHGGLVGPRAGWRAQTERILDAYRTCGMRVSYCFMVKDQRRFTYDSDEEFVASLPPPLQSQVVTFLAERTAPVEDYVEFFEELAQDYNRPGSLIRIQLAPGNLHWCSDRCLRLLNEAARRAGVGLHMHLLETASQKAFADRTLGRSAVEHLAELGLLGPGLTLGHGNWVTSTDLDLIQSSGTQVCHNPSSGLRLQSGIAPVVEMLRRNINVALGIDQAGINDDHDLLQEMRLAWCLHRRSDGPALSSVDVLSMATHRGAMTTPFANEIGTIEAGRAADLVLIDKTKIAVPYLDPATPLVDALLHRTKQEAIDTVIVGGEIVVAQGRTTRVDAEDVMRDIARALDCKPGEAEVGRRRLARELAPFIERSAARWAPAALTACLSRPTEREIPS